MSKASDINAVVFDVGRVLIDVRYAVFFDWLAEHGAEVKGVDDFVARTDLFAYEHGHIDDATFLANLNRLLKRPIDTQQLVEQWLGLFEPDTPMLQLALRLKDRYRVYLLSNTGALHWQHIVPRFQLERYCHNMLASYEVGAMKPAAAIFHAAEQRFALSAPNTVFIDDLAENVAGARRCGWQGIHHTNSADTLRHLAQLGVILE